MFRQESSTGGALRTRGASSRCGAAVRIGAAVALVASSAAFAALAGAETVRWTSHDGQILIDTIITGDTPVSDELLRGMKISVFREPVGAVTTTPESVGAATLGSITAMETLELQRPTGSAGGGQSSDAGLADWTGRSVRLVALSTPPGCQLFAGTFAGRLKGSEGLTVDLDASSAAYASADPRGTRGNLSLTLTGPEGEPECSATSKGELAAHCFAHARGCSAQTWTARVAPGAGRKSSTRFTLSVSFSVAAPGQCDPAPSGGGSAARVRAGSSPAAAVTAGR